MDDHTNNNNYIIDRILHWCGSLMLIFMLMMMGSQVHTTNYTIKGAILHKQEAIEIHFLMGLALLTFLVARIIWSKFFLQKHHKPKFKSKLHKVVATATHLALYSAIFSMMLSGMTMVMNYEHPLPILGLLTLSQNDITAALYTNARTIHLWLESSILVLITGHIGAAMYSRK